MEKQAAPQRPLARLEIPMTPEIRAAIRQKPGASPRNNQAYSFSSAPSSGHRRGGGGGGGRGRGRGHGRVSDAADYARGGGNRSGRGGGPGNNSHTPRTSSFSRQGRGGNAPVQHQVGGQHPLQSV